jgi:hypothetical protein
LPCDDGRVTSPDGGIRFELDRLVSYDDASVLEEMRRVAESMPGSAISRVEFDKFARVKSSTIVRRFGGWQRALDLAGLGDRYGGKTVSDKMRRQRGRSLTVDEITAELKRIADQAGTRTITFAHLKQSDLLSPRVVVSRFGTWRAALEAAGLTLSSMGRRWTDDDYYENLLEVWTHYGRAPKYGEMDASPSRISSGGYEAKFGTWVRAKQAFVDRVNRDIEQGEQEAAAPRAKDPTPQKSRQEDQRSIPIGLRYKVLRRDRFRCVICGRSPATDLDCHLHVDHITAFSRGGKTREDNLRSLCAECNLGKGDGD